MVFPWDLATMRSHDGAKPLNSSEPTTAIIPLTCFEIKTKGPKQSS